MRLLTKKEVLKRLNISETRLTYLRKREVFPNCIKSGNQFLFAEQDVQDIERKAKEKAKVLNVKEACDLLGMCIENFYRHYKHNGFFKTLKIIDGNIFVDKQEILDLVEENREYNEMECFVTTKEASEKLGINQEVLYRYLKRGLFPNAKRTRLYSSYWKIPMSDIEDYIEQIQMKKMEKLRAAEKKAEKKKAFGSRRVKPPKYKTVEEKVDDYISKMDFNIDIKETVELYRSYHHLKYYNSSRKGKQSYSSRLLLTLSRLSKIISKEIFMCTDKDILELISNPQFKTENLKMLIGFINYVPMVKENCIYKNKYFFSNKINIQTDKDIYTKEEFKDFYMYIKNIKIHKERAIEDRIYAESWFYIAMHFINAWRSSDILDFPCSQLELVGNLKANELLDINLTKADAQLIINTVRETNDFLVNKTFALNKFLVNMDISIPIATMILILEFHNKTSMEISKDKLLVILNKEKRKGNVLKIFLDRNTKLPKFSSLKMNRSLLTYFFHSVTQGSKNGDVAHLLARKMRSHMNEDTISQYVMNTNGDDYIDEVSYNLFRRGHFGWLYNSLVDIVIRSKEKELTLEEKTLLIEQYQKIYSPQVIEQI